MKLFECQNCGQLVYFENTQCERCGFPLGFLPDVAMLTALKANGSGGYTPLSDPARSVSYCANFAHVGVQGQSRQWNRATTATPLGGFKNCWNFVPYFNR